ncbi:MAG TPA: phage terminase large subunit, partial [Nitrospiria bacterium]|nr:phage terminase large subunit [Nitrospiria bacterium]
METNVELLKKKLDELPQDKLQEVAEQAHALVPECWLPNPGPQKEAYDSPADVLLYGGQAGGGKSSLATGLALTRHKNSLLIRRQYSDMGSLIEDTLKQYGTRDGYNGSAPASLRTHDGRRIVFGGAKDPGDEEHFKGQPFDLLVLDEASQFLKSQFQFLSGWNRSAEPGQRCRILLATNPPEKPSEGQWLMEMFRPWLDPSHPNPAKPGELRWFISDEEGEDREVDGPDIIQVGLDQDGKPRMVRPLSRTFIPARLSDNPFLTGTGYDSRLDSLPEPLRSAVRDGNWLISHDDDEWQLFPTNWLLQAQQRWTDMPPDAPMCSMGVDIAQGGKDRTVIVNRYGNWFSRPISVPGRETPQGSDVAALVMKYRRNNADV